MSLNGIKNVFALGEQLTSGRRERRTLSSYQYRSSQTEIRMKSQTSGQDVPTSPEKPRTRRKGSLSSPALNRVCVLKLF